MNSVVFHLGAARLNIVVAVSSDRHFLAHSFVSHEVATSKIGLKNSVLMTSSTEVRVVSVIDRRLLTRQDPF